MQGPSNPFKSERGVYFLPHLSSCGSRVLVALTRSGREVARAVVTNEANRRIVAARLEEILSLEDPAGPGLRPQNGGLRLVKDEDED